MRAVQSELAGEVATVLAPVLSGRSGSEATDRLWSLLSGYPKVGRLARFPDDDELEADLAREVGRVLHGNRPLQARVSQLLAEELGARSA